MNINNNGGISVTSSSYLDEKLHRFCQDGNFEELKSYLNHGMTARVNLKEGQTGDTPLHYAAR